MAITNGLITLADAKKSIFNNTPTGTDNDADIEDYIEAATPVIEDIVGPVRSRAETYQRDGGKHGIALPHPFRTVVSLEEDGHEVTAFVASASAGIIYAGAEHAPRRFASGSRNITATVTVGVAATEGEVPPHVKLAARELVRFWWQQGRQGGTRPGIGGEAPESADVPSGFAVPRRVLELLKPDKQIGGFA